MSLERRAARPTILALHMALRPDGEAMMAVATA
jgi:hypothetical protein